MLLASCSGWHDVALLKEARFLCIYPFIYYLFWGKSVSNIMQYITMYYKLYIAVSSYRAAQLGAWM